MLYIIDGYNLMFRFLRAGDDLKTQRETLIRDLNHKIAILKLEVILVFDAQYQERETSSIQHKHLEIHFTEHGETADDYIVKLVKRAQNPLNITVITCDKKLSWLIRRKNGKTETVDVFLKWINNKYRNTLKKEKTPFIKKESYLDRISKNPPTEPLNESTKEDCFSYYLDYFQKEFNQIINEKQVELEKKSAGKKKPRQSKMPKGKAEPSDLKLTNEERWLKAFGRDISNNASCFNDNKQ